MEYYLGFDVGTGSARAALLDKSGQIIADATEATITYRSPTDHRIFEQSTQNIWTRLCLCSKRVLESSGVSPKDIKGISFDATCSLAVVNGEGVGISVSEEEGLGKVGGDRNVILWADHRAEEEALLINSTGEGVLSFVGGTMSLEMEIPKTLWLSKHLSSETFAASQFYDLPDYLTYKATGAAARSTCSLACKFSYVPPGTKMTHFREGDGARGVEEVSKGWSESFLGRIGLKSLVETDYAQIGGVPGKNGLILTAGQPVGSGLTPSAASELGLLPGTPVGSAVIDAYAGWIGTIAATTADAAEEEAKPTLKDSAKRLAAVAGTSTCHVVQSEEGILVNGVWGPYHHAIFPGWWMNEGGQSSTGQLIDFMMTTHPAYPKLLEAAKLHGGNVFAALEEILEKMKVKRGCSSWTHLTRDLHFYPDLHGNRSPLADPRMRGMITGLALDDTLNDLAMKLNVTMEAIALQTRHILDEMNSKGHIIDSIYMSGSQAKNKPLMALLASVCGVKVIIPPQASAAVVIGAAMLGRCAAEVSAQRQAQPITTQEEAEKSNEAMKGKLWDIMVEMTPQGTVVLPSATPAVQKLLDVKYKIFRESIEIQRRWRTEVEEVCGADGVEQ